LVFVSIDDKEVHNLRKVMDEIFGEENFVAQFVWNTEGHTDNQFDVKVNHEYVVLYAREWTNAALEPVVDPSTREESNLWKGFAENSITKNGPGNPPSEVTLPVGFPCAVDALRLAPTSVDSSFYSKVGEQGYISRSITREFGVSYPIRIDPMVVESGKLAQQCRVFSGWANADKLRAFIGGQCEPLQGEQGDATRFYLSGGGVIYYRKDRAKARYILSVLRNMGTVEKARSELEQMGVFFDYPKPKELLKYLISIGLGEQGTLVDFFAGSATSAHATLDLNRNSGGRRFVMVQLQEPTNEDSMARKAGFGTIADVGRERVRWVVAEMKKEAEGKLQTDPPQDLGFRVYKLAESNMKPWKGTDEKDPEKYAKTMEMFLDPLVEGWKPENVIAEVALKTDGFGLNCRVERIGHEGTKDTKEKNGSPVIFKVTDEDKEQSFYICLDDKVRLEDVKFLNLTRDMLFVCRDVALDDETAANLALQCRLRTI
jgi:adenine-specific DNA-methyltransferase